MDPWFGFQLHVMALIGKFCVQEGCKVSQLQDEWEDGIGRYLAKKKLKRLFQGWRRITNESKYLQAFLQ